MRIAFLIAKQLIAGGGGIEKVTREVGRRLAARGHHVECYSTRGEGEEPAEWAGLEMRWMPRFRPYWTEKPLGSLYAAVRARLDSPVVDVYHLHSVAAGAMAGLLGRRAPCLLQMHGVEWQRSRWSRGAKAVLHSLERMSFRYASALTAVSRRQCDFYQQRYGRPVEFIPTGTALPEAPRPELVPELGLPSNRYYFTAVRQVREKGLHYLIPAFLRLETDWHLVIAGGEGGDRAYCRQLREMAGRDPRVHFLGHVTEPLLGSVYASAGAYVQASEIEGMAISLLDAMSHGTCCIVSNIPENLDLVGPEGLSFVSGNIDDLARKMQLAAQNRGQAEALGLAARSRVLSEFTWDAVTNRLESLYYRLAATRIEAGAKPMHRPKSWRRWAQNSGA